MLDFTMLSPRREILAIPPSLVEAFMEVINNERKAQVALATALLYFTCSFLPICYRASSDLHSFCCIVTTMDKEVTDHLLQHG